MYDSSVYYVKGIYNLYKKDDNVIEEELHAMYLSDRKHFNSLAISHCYFT